MNKVGVSLTLLRFILNASINLFLLVYQWAKPFKNLIISTFGADIGIFMRGGY